MDISNANNIIHPARISQTHFTAVVWAAVGVTFLFVVLRIVLRICFPRRFCIDDGLVLLSWLLLLASAIVYQDATPTIYAISSLPSRTDDSSADIQQTISTFSHKALAVYLMFILNVWSIKASVLITLRKALARRESGKQHMLLWWSAVIGTMAGLAICLGVTEYRCTTHHNATTLQTCGSASVLKRIHISLQLMTAFDIITTALIFSIPVVLLRTVAISTFKKLLLASLALFTVLITATSLVRPILLRKEIDFPFLFTLLIVEQIFAIVLGCCVGYNALFTEETPDPQPSSSPYALDRQKSDEKRLTNKVIFVQHRYSVSLESQMQEPPNMRFLTGRELLEA